MRTTSIGAVLTALVLGISTAAFAFVVGPSNFGLFGYPKHTCSKPWSKPSKPYQFEDQWQIDSYNREVDTYNSEVSQYLDCIRTYVDGAKRDIARIKESAGEAIREANSL